MCVRGGGEGVILWIYIGGSRNFWRWGGCSLSWLLFSTIRSGKGVTALKMAKNDLFWGKIFRPKGGLQGVSYILKCNVVTMCWKLIDTHEKRRKKMSSEVSNYRWTDTPAVYAGRKSESLIIQLVSAPVECFETISQHLHIYIGYTIQASTIVPFSLCVNCRKEEKGSEHFHVLIFFRRYFEMFVTKMSTDLIQ